MTYLFDLLFGCHHARYSFPLKSARSSTGKYVVCLSCGAEFEYDWVKMQVGKRMSPITARKPHINHEQNRSDSARCA